MTATGEGGGVALARSIAQTSRPAGSEAEALACARCAEFLISRGFAVTEEPFEYSAWVGRRATPFVGLGLLWFALGGVCSVLWPIGPINEMLGLAAIMSAALVVVAWVNQRWGVLRARQMRREGVNLVARRGIPTIWLVAHLDTKGQPVSLFVRAGGVVLIAVGWLVTLAGWLVYAVGWTASSTAMVSGLILAAIGAVPLAASVVTDRGTGALDNASGIATIFDAVDRIAPDVSIGVLVTTAEELALAGARAWAADRSPAVALNCDGVDDEGAIVCVIGRDPAGRLRQAIGAAVGGRVGNASGRAAPGVRTRRALPGVLFDSVALAQAGWETMTVARGTMRSLGRVHTARDTLANWSGRGVADTAAFLAAVVGVIVATQQAVDGGNHPAGREE